MEIYKNAHIPMTTPNSIFCKQRDLAKLNNIPPVRFNPINPYANNFTKFQLDMRRKVETLKYSSNKSSTQTNNLTKKEKFALLVKGGLSRTQAVIQSNVVDCPADQFIPVPTTSSGVPGPVMYLYSDDTVPLYNYSDFNSRSYAAAENTNRQPWRFTVQPNTLVYNNGTSILYYLLINNTIDKPLYTYNVVTPIGITVAGSIANSDFSGNATIHLVSATLSIYYGEGLAKSITITPSFEMVVNIPTNTGQPAEFSATSFLGNLVFSNIPLYTTPTYVYTFKLSANITMTPNNSVIKYYALVANITNANNVATGPITINTASSPIYVNAAITEG